MANITRYNPVDDLFNELTRGFFVKPLSFPTQADLQVKLDVKEDDKAYKVRAEIPGVKKEDIHVDVEGSHVSVRAEVKGEKQEKEGEKVIYSECSYGMVSRGFDLPTDVDPQGAKAEYKDGVLTDAAEEGRRPDAPDQHLLSQSPGLSRGTGLRTNPYRKSAHPTQS